VIVNFVFSVHSLFAGADHCAEAFCYVRQSQYCTSETYSIKFLKRVYSEYFLPTVAIFAL
jgi:hypothetical protein